LLGFVAGRHSTVAHAQPVTEFRIMPGKLPKAWGPVRATAADRTYGLVLILEDANGTVRLVPVPPLDEPARVIREIARY
jgi:hypothetical protein